MDKKVHLVVSVKNRDRLKKWAKRQDPKLGLTAAADQAILEFLNKSK